MKKYINQISTSCSLLLTVVSFFLFIGPVFSKVSAGINIGGYNFGGDLSANSDSFYYYLGKLTSAYTGIGITILVLMSLACGICVCSLILKFACNKEINYLEFVVLGLLVIAGILTFFVGIASSSSASSSGVSATSKVSISVYTIISGVILIVAGLVNIVPTLNKSSK